MWYIVLFNFFHKYMMLQTKYQRDQDINDGIIPKGEYITSIVFNITLNAAHFKYCLNNLLQTQGIRGKNLHIAAGWCDNSPNNEL